MQRPVRRAAFSAPAFSGCSTKKKSGRVECAVSRRDQLAQHILASTEQADVPHDARAARPHLESQPSWKTSTSRRDILTVGLISVPASNILTSGTARAEGKDEGWYNVPPTNDPKTIMITGASSGLGFAGAGKLAAAGHNLVLVCRTEEKAATACSNVAKNFGPLRGSVQPEACELGSLGDVRGFAERWRRTGQPIDVLCLNAGAQFVGQKAPKRTQEGFELTVGVNHLGHFALQQLLQASVEQSDKQPRIVVTSSEVHDPTSSGGKVGPGASLGDLSGLEQGPAFDMVSGEKFDADKAYKDSKLCNALFMRQLSKRLREQGSNATVNAFGPGLVTRTKFFRSAPSQFIGVFDWVTNDVLGVAETVQGAGDCLAYMAVDGSLDGRSGLYYNNEVSGTPLFAPGHTFMEKLPSKEAQDDAKAQKLWELSKTLVQV